MEPGSLFGQGEGHKYVNVLTIILRMLLFLHLLHLKCIDDDFRIFSYFFLFFFCCHLNFLFCFFFLSFFFFCVVGFYMQKDSIKRAKMSVTSKLE